MAVLKTTSPPACPAIPIELPCNTVPSSSANNAGCFNKLSEMQTTHVQNGSTAWLLPSDFQCANFTGNSRQCLCIIHEHCKDFSGCALLMQFTAGDKDW